MAQRRCIGARGSRSGQSGSAVGVRAGRTISNFLSKWTSQSADDHNAASNTSPAVSRAASRTVVEILEDRRLMSVATVSFASGVLTVRGDDSANNNISVDLSSDGGDIIAKIGSTTGSAAIENINLIKIIGGDENDVIKVDPDIDIRTNINGRSGNDGIWGGGGDDTIFGASGPDTIYGGAGNDKIDGGIGTDKLDGGAGNDSLFGNDGNDSLYGQDGNDTVNGGNGTDSLNGGNGTNVVLNDGSTTGSSGTPTPSPTPSPTPTPTPSPTPSPTPTTTPTGSINATDTPGFGKGSTNAVITTLETSITEGQSIFVNSIKSSLASGTALTAKIEWDFGDAGSKYNNLVGFSAGHVYTDAGTYTIKLKLTDENGVVSTDSVNVTVKADTRRSIYVSQSGNDDNDGSSASEAIKSLARLKELHESIGSNFRILFERGDTWNTSVSAVYLGRLANQWNIDIGAYGSGAQPVLKFTGNPDGAQLINMITGRTNDISIHDITFDSTFAATNNIADYIGANGVRPAGQNITVRNNTFLNIDAGITNVANPVGVMVQDNSVPLATGLRENFIWGQGSDYVILGNNIVNSTREHILRFADANRILIAYNKLQNLDRRSVDSNDYNKKTIVLQNGTWAYIADNQMDDGPFDVSTNTTPNSSTQYEGRGALSRFHWVVAERNQINDTQVNIEPNAWHVVFRDNVINTSQPGLHIRGRDKNFTNRFVADVVLTHNTVINEGTGGDLLYAEAGAKNVTVTNNVFYQDGVSRPINIRIVDTDLKMFDLIDNNIWQSNSANYVDPGAVVTGYKYASAWNSYAEVGDDLFIGFNLGSGFQISAGGVTAGAKL